MSDSLADDLIAPQRAAPAAPAGAPPALPVVSRYGLPLLFVALATVLAFVVRHLIAAPNLTLVYVLPVIIAATQFGWGPALLSVATGVAAFDFFFTEPYYSFAITKPSDIWAAALLLVIAAIASSVAAESRRRALASAEAAERAQALQALAHVIIECRPEAEILKAAATALNRIFAAPAAVFVQGAGEVEAAATAGDPSFTAADREAARGALSARVATRGETYPYDSARFDFWPVSTPEGCDCVLGVDFTHATRERPASPELFVEVIAAYLAARPPIPRASAPRRP